MKKWTKTAAMPIARRARQGGYYQGDGYFHLYVFCPDCRERVECYRQIGVTKTAALDAGMLHHLDGYCPAHALAMFGDEVCAS